MAHAALDVAKQLGLETGGFLFEGFKTSEGPRPMLGFEFGLEEFDIADSRQLIRKNVEASTHTLLLYNTENSSPVYHVCTLVNDDLRRARKTLHRLYSYSIHYDNNRRIEYLCEYMSSVKNTVIHVIGDTELDSPGIYDKAVAVLTTVFSRLRDCDGA